MMPGSHVSENVASDYERDELVAKIGNLYMRRGLSPPSQLRGAVAHWLGLSQGEILAAIEAHSDQHRRLYTCGSSDGHFHMVEAAIRKAWKVKHPLAHRAKDEPARPRRKPGVRKIHNASGFPDVIVDGGPAARLLREPVSNVERPSGLVGYEDAGVPIGEDDDPGESA